MSVRFQVEVRRADPNATPMGAWLPIGFPCRHRLQAEVYQEALIRCDRHLGCPGRFEYRIRAITVEPLLPVPLP